VRRWFRVVAVAEAFSWAGLLVGMLFKHVISGDETGVHVFGPIHGAIFVAYVIACLVAWRTFGWSLTTAALGLTAGVPPFFTVVFERWADRTGRLAPRATR